MIITRFIYGLTLQPVSRSQSVAADVNFQGVLGSGRSRRDCGNLEAANASPDGPSQTMPQSPRLREP